jgi:hypothetical protein
MEPAKVQEAKQLLKLRGVSLSAKLNLTSGNDRQPYSPARQTHIFDSRRYSISRIFPPLARMMDEISRLSSGFISKPTKLSTQPVLPCRGPLTTR